MRNFEKFKNLTVFFVHRVVSIVSIHFKQASTTKLKLRKASFSFEI